MSDPTEKNLTWHQNTLAPEERARLLKQQGAVVWLTGLSGSGKSTVAMALEAHLMRAGRLAYVLDGDNVRHGLNGDLGFSAADRTENIRRVGHLSRLFADAGMVAISAFISPFQADRAAVRALVGSRFLEVHLSTPLAVCEARDPKGLYKRARAGEIPTFTGISSPYEAPEAPELSLDTHALDLEECVRRLVVSLTDAGVFTA
jgi:adenylyl-sulfate kinase